MRDSRHVFLNPREASQGFIASPFEKRPVLDTGSDWNWKRDCCGESNGLFHEKIQGGGGESPEGTDWQYLLAFLYNETDEENLKVLSKMGELRLLLYFRGNVDPFSQMVGKEEAPQPFHVS